MSPEVRKNSKHLFPITFHLQKGDREDFTSIGEEYFLAHATFGIHFQITFVSFAAE